MQFHLNTKRIYRPHHPPRRRPSSPACPRNSREYPGKTRSSVHVVVEQKGSTHGCVRRAHAYESQGLLAQTQVRFRRKGQRRRTGRTCSGNMALVLGKSQIKLRMISLKTRRSSSSTLERQSIPAAPADAGPRHRPQSPAARGKGKERESVDQ